MDRNRHPTAEPLRRAVSATIADLLVAVAAVGAAAAVWAQAASKAKAEKAKEN